jgi:hypothetical protein
MVPLGALLGGGLGEILGLHVTLYVTAAGFMTSLLWVLFSPLPRLRELPAPANDEGADALAAVQSE